MGPVTGKPSGVQVQPRYVPRLRSRVACPKMRGPLQPRTDLACEPRQRPRSGWLGEALVLGAGRAVASDRGVDPPRDRVDRPGVLADRLERVVLAPAGDVGDRLAADVEPDRRADDVGDAIDQHLGPLAAVLLVADAERVRELVNQRAQPAVGTASRHHDLLAPGVAPAAR